MVRGDLVYATNCTDCVAMVMVLDWTATEVPLGWEPAAEPSGCFVVMVKPSLTFFFAYQSIFTAVTRLTFSS